MSRFDVLSNNNEIIKRVVPPINDFTHTIFEVFVILCEIVLLMLLSNPQLIVERIINISP